MWDFLIGTMSYAWIQVVLYLLLLWYFFAHRQDPRMVVSRVGLVHIVVLSLIFVYFLLNWSSGIRPALAQFAVFGMFLVNLHLLNMLVQSRLEMPYREALDAIRQDPQKSERLKHIWYSGKRFYYAHYAFSSLLSGANPFHFLHNMAPEAVRDDIKDTIQQYGAEKRLISLQMMATYLQSRLEGDETLPANFKELMHQAIQEFVKHPWIEDQANEFLRIATETPEDLYFPEWMKKFDQSVQSAAPK